MATCPVKRNSRIAKATDDDIPPLGSDGACGRLADYRVVALDVGRRPTSAYTCTLHIKGWRARGYDVEPPILIIEEDNWTY